MQETAIGKNYASDKVHCNCFCYWCYLNFVVVARNRNILPYVFWRCITLILTMEGTTFCSFISAYNNSLCRDSIQYIRVIRKCIGMMHWLDDFDMKLFIFWRNSWIQELCYWEVFLSHYFKGVIYFLIMHACQKGMVLWWFNWRLMLTMLRK